MDIGLKLRQLRVKNHYSQQYVANYLSISRNAYLAWENNNTELTLSKLIFLCKLYDIDLKTLLFIKIV